ncbi:hypothetical protein BDZ94DRAFT_1315356 [Collybia nuda]|uniref:Uncharacterized protein n=1 Tax=Collybia nuda TaxID=64659 RepID=A0A9P5XTE6_9AGAR|nr:hypothetical protein BDZ94DRAFT_1315356 [Collybia nuda]
MKSLTTDSSAIPMKAALFGALGMAWVWGTIAGCVGLNALIKSNQAQSKFKKTVPAGVSVDINVQDVFASGAVLTTVGALIAVLCSIFLTMLILPFTRSIATRSFRTQSLILAFCSTWLFASLVPFTDFFANRSAKVTATIGPLSLPPNVIKQAEQSSGSTSVYKEIDYLRLVAILPWITLLFAVIAAIVLFMASSRVERVAPEGSVATRDTHSDTGTNEKVVEKRESV